MRIPKRLLTTIALTGGIILGGTAVQAKNQYIETDSAQQSIVTRAGVVRIGPSVYLHTNAAHAAVGINRITLTKNCRLKVWFDHKPGERVMAAAATPDESMARMGIVPGISNGVDAADVYLYKNGKEVCANNKHLGWRTNVWIQITVLKG